MWSERGKKIISSKLEEEPKADSKIDFLWKASKTIILNIIKEKRERKAPIEEIKFQI